MKGLNTERIFVTEPKQSGEEEESDIQSISEDVFIRPSGRSEPTMKDRNHVRYFPTAELMYVTGGKEGPGQSRRCSAPKQNEDGPTLKDCRTGRNLQNKADMLLSDARFHSHLKVVVSLAGGSQSEQNGPHSAEVDSLLFAVI